MKELTLESTDSVDLKTMYDLIKKSNDTNLPIAESVVDSFLEITPALLLWAVNYKKERVAKVEIALSKDTANSACILPYMKHFPDTKDGPLWNKVITCPETALRYAQIIIRDRFEEGELAIIGSSYNEAYIDFLQRVKDAKSGK